MDVTVGTFNLNNLFSRFDFFGQLEALTGGETTITETTEFDFSDATTFRRRTFDGRLIKEKPAADRATIAARIVAMDLDVLAVQEVENVETLRRFNDDELGGLYEHVVLVEGNDDRFIDVGVMSKLPMGRVVSWQRAVHPEDPSTLAFSRDLLEVDILDPARATRLFTFFINHLKSKLIPFGSDPVAEKERSDTRRRRQAELVAKFVREREPFGPSVVVGDMNDSPEAPTLAALASPELGLVNALQGARESRPAPVEAPPPASLLWTHRFRPSGEPAEHELLDQIWISPSLAARQADAVIDRRTKLGGDGSDHDPAWIQLTL
jgi:endonuclease/exonuclease/phosphatase family metal-dependent hydrolase